MSKFIAFYKGVLISP